MAQKKLEAYTVAELTAGRKKLTILFAVFLGLMLVLVAGFAYTFFTSEKRAAAFLMATPLLAFSGVFVVLLTQRGAIDKELARRRAEGI